MSNVEKQDSRMPANLAEMFFKSAEAHAGREALKYKPAHHYHTLSYNQLKSEVMRLVKALARLGFRAPHNLRRSRSGLR